MPRFPDHPERRHTVITGASSGIGEATARAFALRGHPVTLGARRLERCEAAAAELREAGCQATAAYLDVADVASVEQFVTEAQSANGPIEIAIANAGVVEPITAHAEPAKFAAQINTNLMGVQSLIWSTLPGMLERKRGDVVIVSSDSAVRPRTFMGGYAAAKAGAEAFAAVLRSELEGTGVRCSVVRPGPASTEQGTTWDASTIESVLASWDHHGFLRHHGALRPVQVADAIATAALAPRGVLLSMIEIQPEAPLREAP